MATIFLADRDDRYRGAVADALRRRGDQVVEFASGSDLYAHTIAYKPDLVVLEADLQDMDGFQVFAALRAALPEKPFPVVFLTAFDNPQVARVCKLRGAKDYLAKRLSLEGVVRAIRRWAAAEEAARAAVEPEERSPTLLKVTGEQGRQPPAGEDVVARRAAGSDPHAPPPRRSLLPLRSRRGEAARWGDRMLHGLAFGVVVLAVGWGWATVSPGSAPTVFHRVFGGSPASAGGTYVPEPVSPRTRSPEAPDPLRRELQRPGRAALSSSPIAAAPGWRAGVDERAALATPLRSRELRALVDRRSGQLSIVLPWTDPHAIRGEEGLKATAAVLVNALGAVEEVRLVRSSGYPELDRMALDAVRGFSYRPARRSDSAVTAWVGQEVVFEVE
jgi:TonB family protein